MLQPANLSALHLDIGHPKSSVEFYTTAIGMRLVAKQPGSHLAETIYRLAFGRGAELRLRHRSERQVENPGYRPSDNDVYWKIGITVPDVDLARACLIDRGIGVTEPVQFHDIGYLCHFDDPDGYCIELLQHRFACNHVPASLRGNYALGSEPTLGQISLNVSDIDASLAFYRERLGMRLLSRQVVPGCGFTLYFLADTEEKPPVPGIDSIENREWLWQRPYTTLELRAFDADRSLKAHPPEEELGFRGIEVGGSERHARRDPDGVHLFVG